MDLELGVQITRPVGGLAFASTETDAVFILFAHLPGFIKDEIEVELNEAGTEISISSRGEIGERSFIDAEISGRVRISHHELMEGFRKAFPIPNNVVLNQIEVGFEEEEGILIVLLPKLTREDEPSGVEIEEINEENIREEEEEDDDDDDDDDDERTSMTIEAEETSPDYNKEKAQEQQNLGEVEPKSSTEKFKGKPDGKPEAGSREATTKIAIEDKKDSESELIIEELGFTITASISKEPIASKSEEEKEKEEEAPEQKNLNELEVSKSLEALESEAEGLESKEIAIGAQIDDKEEETGLIIEELDFTIIPLPLDEPIIFEASEVEEEEEEEETTFEEKEQKQKNLYELDPTISLGESEGEPDEEIELQCKEIAIEAEIIDDDEEKNELIIEESDFTTTPPPQEEQIALKASDSKEEEKKKKGEEEKEKVTGEEVVEQKDLDELDSKKILEALEGGFDGKTNSEHREMTIEAQSGDKEEEKAGPIKEESDFTRTSPSEEHVALKISELKEKEKKSTREEVPKQNDLDKLEPKKNSEVLDGEFDGKTKQEYREMTIEAQTGDKEKEKTGLIRKEPDFTKTPPLSEESVTSKASELKGEKENTTWKGVAEQQNLGELKPKKILEALEGESDEKIKSEHREIAIEVQSGDKEGEKTGFIREEPDFTRTPPSEKSIALKTFELKEEEKKATWEEVLEKKDLDELEKPKKISKALESEYDEKTKLGHREIVIEAQTEDKKEEKIRLIKEDPGFTITPPPSEKLIASKAFELREEEENAIGEEVSEQKDLGELELKKKSNVLESESDGKTKPEHPEMAIETQIGDEKEEKTILVRDEPYFIRTPPLSEKPVALKTFELKEEEEKTTGGGESEQKDLDELRPKKISKALEGEYDGKTKSESQEMTIEAQIDKKKEEKIGLIREEPDFTRTSQPSEKSIVSKAFELKEEDEKATEKEVQEQKDLGELESKKISEVLEDESDGKIKLEYQEMAIEAQTGNKEEEKNRLTKEESDFTRTHPLSEKPIASKAFELKEEKEKATDEEVPEQKDLDERESKTILKAPESEPDGKIKSEHREMTIEAQTGDKEEEKAGSIREKTDFTRTHLPSKESVASKASELKAKEEKTTGEEVSEQKDLDELDQKKNSEAQGEFDRKTKQVHREMTIEAQTRDKEEEKSEPIREELDFTRTSHPSEEPVISKASKLKKKEEMATGEGVSEQQDLDELKPKKILEALKGESDGKTKQEHREMAIEVQIGDKEEKKNGLLREESDFTRIPPLGKPITSKTFELKEEEEKATWEKVQEQKNLDELEPKKISKALESESDGKTKPEHREMIIEAQTGDKEKEKIKLIREKSGFTRTPSPSEELIASKSFELKEDDEKAIEEKIPEQKDLDELKPKKISKTLEDEPDGKTKLEHREMTIEAQIGDKEEKKIGLIRDEPDFTRTPPPSEKLVVSKVSELKENEDEAIREEVSKQKHLCELELQKISKVLESESDGKTKPEHREMVIEAQIGDKKEEKTILIRDEPNFIRTPPLIEKPVASKTFELKEEEEKTTWGEISKQKDIDELGSKKISEALEDESDEKTKPESRETIIEGKISNKKEEKIGLIREESDFTRTSPPPLKESIVPKTFELKEEEEKAIEKKVQEQKDLDELESKKISKVLEDESDRKTKSEYQEMAIETQTGDKEEEKNGLTRVEPDFTRAPPPSEKPIASKAFELKEEEEKATREEVSEQKDLDELESKKILKAIEGEPDGKTKSEHREMTIEAQTSDKEKKAGPIREESDFTITPLLLEELVASKASELKEEEEKTTGEEVSEKKDLDELDQKKNSEVLEGESNEKIKPEHREMAIKAQTGDKEEEKTELIRETLDFTRTPLPLKEPVASKAFELKEDEDNATKKEVSKQKDLNELEPKKILEALEGEPDGKSKPKHQEMAIEAQTGVEEEKNGLIRKEPYFTRIPLPSEEPVASKASKLKEENEKVIEKKVPEQKYLDELELKKILEALEGESNGKNKREYREMAIEEQTCDKEEEKIRLIREGPYFIRASLPSEEPDVSKTFELKEEEEKAARKEVQKQKDLDRLELEKGLEASEGEPNEKIEFVPTEMAIEAPSEHKEEPTRIHTKEPEFTIAPLALDEPILSYASKLKEEEEEEKAHRENTEEPKNLEKKIQSKTFEEEKKEKAIEEKSQEQKSLDELQVKKSSEEIKGEPWRETKPEPKKTAIGTQTKYKEEEETRRITEEPDITVSPSPLEDLIASKSPKSKEENEEQHEKAPTEEIPYSPPISPNIMAKPKSNGEQLDTTDSHEKRDRDVEVPRQALETFESIESLKQEEDRHGFGKEDAKEPKNVEEITHDPGPKTLTRTVTLEDVDSDRRRDGEHEARETKIRALREDDREIVSDVDGVEDASREWEEGESSDRDQEKSRGEMETRKEEKENNRNGKNGIGKNAQRKRRRRKKRGSSFHLPPTDVIAGSVFVLTLAALVIRLIKKRGSHTMR